MLISFINHLCKIISFNIYIDILDGDIFIEIVIFFSVFFGGAIVLEGAQ